MKKTLIIIFSFLSCNLIYSQQRHMDEDDFERMNEALKMNLVYIDTDKDSLTVESHKYTFDITPLDFLKGSLTLAHNIHYIGTERSRGYRLNWEIINNSLYITNIELTEYAEKINKFRKELKKDYPDYPLVDEEVTLSNTKKNLTKFLGRDFRDGKIKADWFTGGLYAVDKNHDVYFLKFRDGKFIAIEKKEGINVIDLDKIRRESKVKYRW